MTQKIDVKGILVSVLPKEKKITFLCQILPNTKIVTEVIIFCKTGCEIAVPLNL
ncbi:MAG: hypothetical protein ACI8WB_000613 [Phenylobacterium sp.]|jgi:hypothetical protein